MSTPTEPQPTILVVDDNEANRALAAAALEEECYRVVVASSGEDALAAFARATPDCVLLDVRMPGMDGFEVCARLRALPGGADVPVVFLTALRDVDTFDAALRAGGDDFLTKPVRPTELVVRVQAALRLRRLNAVNRDYHELLRRQRDDLMRLQLQKERLSAFLVHDLKNPVATVDLLAQVLLRDKELPASARESVAAIRGEMQELMRLILNLLDISRSEEGKLTPVLASVELSELSHRVVESLAVRAEWREVTLFEEVPSLSVRADADLLRRVLENLIDNAVRHAPVRTTVTVSAKRADDAVELRVADGGAGIPPELRAAIFEPFVQLESRDKSRSRSGRGLGLTFCRLAVEAQGGTISVEDVPGTVFCVRLPHAE